MESKTYYTEEDATKYKEGGGKFDSLIEVAVEIK